MNMKEAEIYFKRYDGHGFHMYREEPGQYERYKALKISPEIEEQWRQEIIQTVFQSFFEDPQKVRVQHSRIIEIVMGTKTQVENNCLHLLTLMEQLSFLDTRQITLIIEKMAGRTDPRMDGGCYLICSRTSLHEKMNSVMQNLIQNALDSREISDKEEERLFCAINNYESAYSRFSVGTRREA